MKKLIALALILASVFALCACGEAAPAAATVTAVAEPVVTEKIVEVEKEVPVIPEEYVPFKDLLDALVAEDYDSAQTILDELKPEPEKPDVVEITITKDNFFDYFEYVEWYDKYLEKTSSGKVKAASFNPTYILKAEYAIAQENVDDCNVEVGVKYKCSYYYRTNTLKKVKIDYDKLTFSSSVKADETQKEDSLLTGWVYRNEEGQMTCKISFNGPSYYLSKEMCQIINKKDISLVSAKGTLYLLADSIPESVPETTPET